MLEETTAVGYCGKRSRNVAPLGFLKAPGMTDKNEPLTICRTAWNPVHSDNLGCVALASSL
jgi:hypothetical protein